MRNILGAQFWKGTVSNSKSRQTYSCNLFFHLITTFMARCLWGSRWNHWLVPLRTRSGQVAPSFMWITNSLPLSFQCDDGDGDSRSVTCRDVITHNYNQSENKSSWWNPLYLPDLRGKTPWPCIHHLMSGRWLNAVSFWLAQQFCHQPLHLGCVNWRRHKKCLQLSISRTIVIGGIPQYWNLLTVCGYWLTYMLRSGRRSAQLFGRELRCAEISL